MSLFPESSPPPGGRAVLLSIKPKYADLILGGSKRVEFRRAWASQHVRVIVLYSSSPIQKIVGVVEVNDVLVAAPSSLWQTCMDRGGGLTRLELRAYFLGKVAGVAVLLGKVCKSPQAIEPSDVIDNFVPPQSFRYLDEMEYIKIEKKMIPKKGAK